MSFSAAVGSGFRQYATFTGRSSRDEYWWFVLFTSIIYMAAATVDATVATVTGAVMPVFTGLAILTLLLPGLAVVVRRLHDTDHSGLWYLVSLIPFGALVLLVMVCQASTSGANRFGETAAGQLPYASSSWFPWATVAAWVTLAVATVTGAGMVALIVEILALQAT